MPEKTPDLALLRDVVAEKVLNAMTLREQNVVNNVAPQLGKETIGPIVPSTMPRITEGWDGGLRVEFEGRLEKYDWHLARIRFMGHHTMSQGSSSLWIASVVSYSLHAVVAIAAILPGIQASIALLLLAVLIDLLLRSDAEGTWYESHFRFRLRSVALAGFLYVATIPLWLLLVVPGWIAWALISLWFAYRIIKGSLRMLDRAAI